MLLYVIVLYIMHWCDNFRRDDPSDALAQLELWMRRDAAQVWSESECKSCDIMA